MCVLQDEELQQQERYAHVHSKRASSVNAAQASLSPAVLNGRSIMARDPTFYILLLLALCVTVCLYRIFPVDNRISVTYLTL